MRFLPIGLDLRERLCVVVGGGEVGTRKVLTLLEAGAAVTVVSPDASEEISALAQAGSVRWIQEKFEPNQLREAFLVVAATDDGTVNQEVTSAARARSILICDASARGRTQVIFGALHQTPDATVAVFSDGESPERAQTLRDRVAELLESAASGPREHVNTEPTEMREAPRAWMILVVHGSRDPRWRRSLEELLGSVQRSAPHGTTHLAYVQFTGPTLSDVVAQGHAGGITHFRLLPLFMASAGHVEKDILPLVDELRQSYPDFRFEVLTPIGESPLFHRLIGDIAKQTTS